MCVSVCVCVCVCACVSACVSVCVEEREARIVVVSDKDAKKHTLTHTHTLALLLWFPTAIYGGSEEAQRQEMKARTNTHMQLLFESHRQHPL